MAGLVFFWSLAAFVALVAVLVFRPAVGNVLSPSRRRAFAAVLGTAMAGLALLAGTIPEQRVHGGAVILAALAGAVFACLVNVQLAPSRPRAETWNGRTRGALLVLGVAMPLAVLAASWMHHPRPLDAGRSRHGIVAPSLGEVIMHARGGECETSWSDRNVTARLHCAFPDLQRQWLITTELREGSAPPLYLVRTCVVGGLPRMSSPCGYSIQALPPGDAMVDLAPERGVTVPPSASLVASFDPEHARWAIETVMPGVGDEPGSTVLVDARSLGIAPAPAIEDMPHLQFPPASWAALLAVWAAGAGLALRAHRAARRQQAQLGTAWQAELRDGLLHVDGETAPRQLIARPHDSIQHVRGPVVWNPRTSALRSERELAPYRRSGLALAADVAPGELEEHHERARAAGNRAFAVFAALIGAGALPVLVAAMGHLADPVRAVQFTPQSEKRLVDVVSSEPPEVPHF